VRRIERCPRWGSACWSNDRQRDGGTPESALGGRDAGSGGALEALTGPRRRQSLGVGAGRSSPRGPPNSLGRPIWRKWRSRTSRPMALYCHGYTRRGFASHADHDRVLHRLKLRAPGRQVGGRARAAVSRCERGASPGFRWTLRGIEGRHAGLPEVEARTTCGAGRDRKIVARGTLTTVPAPDPGRCVVWTRWPVARRTLT
jgi:hypothetical protein